MSAGSRVCREETAGWHLLAQMTESHRPKRGRPPSLPSLATLPKDHCVLRLPQCQAQLGEPGASDRITRQNSFFSLLSHHTDSTLPQLPVRDGHFLRCYEFRHLVLDPGKSAGRFQLFSPGLCQMRAVLEAGCRMAAAEPMEVPWHRESATLDATHVCCLRAPVQRL